MRSRLLLIGRIVGRAQFWSALMRTLRAAHSKRFGMIASSIAFFSFLALLPLLGAVTLAYGMFTEPEQVVQDIRAFVQFLPGNARQLVGSWLVETITEPEGRGLGLLLSTTLALYGGMRAGQAVIAGLNIASGSVGGRGFFGKRAASLLMVFSGSALILVALFALSALAFLERLVTQGYSTVVPIIRTVFWSVATIGAGLALLVIYRYAPARKPPSFRRVAPGAVCATLIWLLATVAFGFYLGSFGTYQRTYGSLGAVIVLQIWLFLSAYTLLLGARLNVELERSSSDGGYALP